MNSGSDVCLYSWLCSKATGNLIARALLLCLLLSDFSLAQLFCGQIMTLCNLPYLTRMNYIREAIPCIRNVYPIVP